MKIKGILKRVNELPMVIEFENTLENLQKFVGGYIEILSIDDDVDIVLNEEGKLFGLKNNITLVKNEHICDRIVGDIVLVGADNLTGETISIPEDKIEKLMNVLTNELMDLDNPYNDEVYFYL